MSAPVLQMSAPAPPVPPARKKYTLAEVFGEDDDEEDEPENNDEVAAAGVTGPGRQDFGRPPPPPVPGICYHYIVVCHCDD